MEEKIRVLGIAPFESMKYQMSSLAREYPLMELTLFVGDREAGLKIAQENFHGNFDVVISRGGTASILKKVLPLPVIEVEISSYDILCSLRLAGGLHSRIALVCAENIAPSAQRLKEVMNLDMEIYEFDSLSKAEEACSLLDPQHFDIVLCDNIAYTIAKTRSLNAFLILSSQDNIRHAFDQASLLYRSQKHLREENLFLRELLHWQVGYTTILDEHGGIYLSTMEPIVPELLELLRRELPESLQSPERRISRSLNGTLYMIRTRCINIGALRYIAFFYDIRRTPLSSSHTGICSFTRPEVEERYCRSIFSTSGFMNDANASMEQLSQSRAPVMIIGETGCGKESAVDILYLRGPLRNNPLVQINCAGLKGKEWDFLLEHHNSPLADEGSTLFFVNVDVVPSEQCHRLLSVLTEMHVCNRNRVYFSCVCNKDEALSPMANEIVNNLMCLTLELPPLREFSHRLPVMINQHLSQINEDVPNQILGIEPRAVELLQQFHWPHNHNQFRRVFHILATTATGQIITEEAVRTLLSRERRTGSFNTRTENADIPLDLTRPLEEINREIARRVVEETGGNQTSAAKRLGISRTTLWRMIQSER